MNTHNRSSVEVEQILPSTEHGPDPRDFYASDSPVLDEYFDAGQGSGCVDPEDEDDDQVESIIACCVWFSYLTYTSQANWCETFPATSAPVLDFVFTNRRAIIFTNRRAIIFTSRRAIIFTNCRAIVFSADVAFAAINDSRNSALRS
jgi:hypothetical protein